MTTEIVGSRGSFRGMLDGSGSSTWSTAFHDELVRQRPGAFVYRMHDNLDDLTEWLESDGVVSDRDGLFYCGGYDDDRDGPRFEPDGGHVRFRWEGREYEVLAVRAYERWKIRVTSWLVAPDRAAAEQLIAAVATFARTRGSSVMVFEDGDWEEAPRLAADLHAYRWEDVVLPAEQIERLRGTAERFFASESVYRDQEIPWKLGYLYKGTPGTGKTLTTKILAATCGVRFLYVRSAEKGCGDEPTSSTIREIFQGARDRAPCILCLEDVDSLVSEKLRSTFLNEMDGLDDSYRGVLTVATTNHPEKLDVALLTRPSRFDFRFEFPLPEDGQRRAFLLHWTARLAKLGYLPSAALPETALAGLVRRSRGMSHAYLKRVLIGVAMQMHHREERGVAAFLHLAEDELADATGDRSIGRRAESRISDAIAGEKVGFRLE